MDLTITINGKEIKDLDREFDDAIDNAINESIIKGIKNKLAPIWKEVEKEGGTLNYDGKTLTHTGFSKDVGEKIDKLLS